MTTMSLPSANGLGARAAAENRGAPAPERVGVRATLRHHWPEYLMEAAELGAFLISACLFVALLSHPDSPLARRVPDPAIQRVLIGMAMGLTATAIIYSPWGKQSGAHFNPAVTLTFWRLGKVASWDAAGYAAAQFVGAVAGVIVSAAVLGRRIADPAVNYVCTLPGPGGPGAAFAAELLLSCGLMTLVLTASNHARLARHTGVLVGIVVALYIAVEAPVSGMSLNPARSFAPALVGSIWNGLWLYFIAPPLGMLLAAELHLRRRGAIECAKLHHRNDKRCIFCGGRDEEKRALAAGAAAEKSIAGRL
jgi:aquaporin Z